MSEIIFFLSISIFLSASSVIFFNFFSSSLILFLIPVPSSSSSSSLIESTRQLSIVTPSKQYLSGQLRQQVEVRVPTIIGHNTHLIVIRLLNKQLSHYWLPLTCYCIPSKSMAFTECNYVSVYCIQYVQCYCIIRIMYIYCMLLTSF